MQILSNSAKPWSATRATNGAIAGAARSLAHSAEPHPIKKPATGTSSRLASGPISEARPNVAANRGHSAAAMARLIPSKVRAWRAAAGHERGADASRRRATQSTAAVPPTLMSAPAESAEAGDAASRTAAATVKPADGVVGRSSRRAAAAAASMSQARSLGGSPPAISA
ncbi:MAG TPA: hypothetical protein VN915_13925 [Elusimicrobiota bacterium]|nr:hypothetical protein [Elusimicrobiota bacterium]